ncbi:hypothetical protein AB0368_06760 [Actinoplanes sp. NPDC051475]|uniref:hypothetical protein n=1 Tax=Actinoplanes sp. NPDC051475 TaxID=3157225 RepID=UPI00344FA121
MDDLLLELASGVGVGVADAEVGAQHGDVSAKREHLRRLVVAEELLQPCGEGGEGVFLGAAFGAPAPGLDGPGPTALGGAGDSCVEVNA